MRDIFKPALSLVLICALITFFVALTYNVTKNSIKDREWEELSAAMNEVLPDGAPYANITNDFKKKVDTSEEVDVNEVYQSEDGFVFKVTVSGYGGDVVVIIGINIDSSINGIRLGSNSETPSLGKQAEEPFFTARFAGLLTRSDICESVDSISGVTITSDAVKLAVQKACDYYNDLNGGAGK